MRETKSQSTHHFILGNPHEGENPTKKSLVEIANTMPKERQQQ
jgi:hypothetical protein